MDDIIKKYFYDVNKGFVSVNKLYKKLKEDGHKIPLKQVQNFYENQEVKQKGD